jgi:uncharacterized protein YacL
MFRPIVLARILFVAVATASGFWIFKDQWQGGGNSTILAFVLAILTVLFEYSLRTVTLKRLVLAALGFLFGLIVSNQVYQTIPVSVLKPAEARIVCNLVFGYLGLVIALKHADIVDLGSFRFLLSQPDSVPTRILDTSVIIDGRVEEVLKSGFLPGPILCPSFVIDELQSLSDSSDPIRRGKGRRGLTILKSIQDGHPALQIIEKNYPGVRDVDRKLLELAKEINAQIITNDYNLQKVADLHGVPILNINALATLLRPAVFVGETFALSIQREGKEPRQGVGYLEDGTMVVVDDGRDHIGQEIEILVTSVLQTNTGRMVFGRPVGVMSAVGNGNGVH